MSITPKSINSDEPRYKEEVSGVANAGSHRRIYLHLIEELQMIGSTGIGKDGRIGYTGLLGHAVTCELGC